MNPPPTTAGQRPAPEQTNQNSAELASIKVESRVPQFWADMPRMWFAQFEAVMGPQKQGDAVNFQVAVAKLTKDALQQAADIIMTPPEEKKYEALKKRLLEAFEESAERKFQKLVNEMDLGSQRPSQLLRKMSALAHSTEVGEEVVKRLWIARLPGAIKAVLSVCTDTKLEKLTEMADKVSESLQTGEIAAVSTANTPPAGEMTRMIADMAKELKEMRQEVNEIRGRAVERGQRWNPARARSGSRGPRRTPNSPDWLCRHHFKYGRNARSCEKPCSWKPAAGQSEN